MSEEYKYHGLRRRPSFDELITYNQKDKPKIPYLTEMHLP